MNKVTINIRKAKAKSIIKQRLKEICLKQLKKKKRVVVLSCAGRNKRDKIILSRLRDT